jgi:hypothetical protein
MLNKDNNWNNKIIPEDIATYFSRELTLYGNNFIITIIIITIIINIVIVLFITISIIITNIIITIIIIKIIILFLTISIIIPIMLGSDIPITYAWNLASLLRLHSKVFGKNNIRVIR